MLDSFMHETFEGIEDDMTNRLIELLEDLSDSPMCSCVSILSLLPIVSWSS